MARTAHIVSRLSRLTVLVPAVIFCASNPAGAYKIRSKPGIHEAMTLLAERCVREAEPLPPSNCGRFASLIESLSRRQPSYDVRQIAVRWPDDPGRQIGSRGLLNFLTNVLFNCPRITAANPDTLDTLGIVCSSHYGRLQFMHAMASTSEEERRGPEATRVKIFAWADFTYRLAVGAGEPRPSDGLCGYFQTHASEISASFECSHDFAREWTIAALFNWRCTRRFSMATCHPYRPPAERDAQARVSAEGALLHLIQDSYSQSHVARGTLGPHGRYLARVDCHFPSHFYTYQGQRGHGAADQVPEFDPSCRGEGGADDAITASAMVIYHLQRKSSPQEFLDYLRRRVFETGMS
jgi:hypothetical protein